MKVVIVGQGYVGLPLAQGAVEAGYEVVGLDLNEERVRKLNAGESVVDDISDDQVAEMISHGYKASASVEEFNTADVVVICVPTPLGDGRVPDLTAVNRAADDIANRVPVGTLVVLESTTYPGTTKIEIAPKFMARGHEIGRDIYLAFSPERIDPGNATYGIKNTPKVVGADDTMSLQRAVDFYSRFIDEVVPVSGTAEAELTKLLENTYRHINIGLVNELAIVCNDLDIDVWEVIRAAETKPFGFQAFFPGPGVGGHCIPIDPNYLNHRVRQALGHPFRFVELAEDINSSMPNYVVSRAQELLNSKMKSVNGSNVLLLGVTYKSGISDTRQSPASDVANILTSKGATVSYFDPLVNAWPAEKSDQYRKVSDVWQEVKDFDLVILLQDIPGLDLDALAVESKSFLDTRGLTKTPKANRL